METIGWLQCDAACSGVGDNGNRINLPEVLSQHGKTVDQKRKLGMHRARRIDQINQIEWREIGDRGRLRLYPNLKKQVVWIPWTGSPRCSDADGVFALGGHGFIFKIVEEFFDTNRVSNREAATR